MNGGFNDMQADDIEGQLYNCQGERDFFREDRLRIATERDALQALNDAQHGIIEELGDQRDALQALVNRLADGLVITETDDGQYHYLDDELLAELRAAKKDAP